MLSSLKAQSIKNYLKSKLLGSDIPLWLHLLLLIITAFGVYVVVPNINQKLELQRIRSEFVVGALNNIASDVSSLSISVSEINKCVMMGASECLDQKHLLDSSIIKLQYRLAEGRRLVDDSATSSVIICMQGRLRDLQLISNQVKDIQSADKMNALFSDVARSSLDLSESIAYVSGISKSRDLNVKEAEACSMSYRKPPS